MRSPNGEDDTLPRPLKRQKTIHNGTPNRFSHDSYTIAWICALPIEMAAAQAMLDEIHGDLPRGINDHNAYKLGSIKDHNIAIACLPEYGNNNAAHVLASLRSSFPKIRRALMVGIGGGAPSRTDLRLGDVVVGTRVMQHDFGKVLLNGEVQRTAIPKLPELSLRTAVSSLRADHELRPSQVPVILREKMADYMDYSHPPTDNDILFESSYAHNALFPDCQQCDSSRIQQRQKRTSQDPVIHYGAIASGNCVIKDAETRDAISRELDVICFEMEAAGLMDSLACLPIRGICDYSDSHKAKRWQKYAAATAAAYARELLEELSPDDIVENSHVSNNPGRPPSC